MKISTIVEPKTITSCSLSRKRRTPQPWKFNLASLVIVYTLKSWWQQYWGDKLELNFFQSSTIYTRFVKINLIPRHKVVIPIPDQSCKTMIWVHTSFLCKTISWFDISFKICEAMPMPSEINRWGLNLKWRRAACIQSIK